VVDVDSGWFVKFIHSSFTLDYTAVCFILHCNPFHEVILFVMICLVLIYTCNSMNLA